MPSNNQTVLNFQFVETNKKAMIIGQAPPQKTDTIPFKKTRLYKWFNEIYMSPSDVLQSIEFEALINFYPGKGNKGDNKPKNKDILKHIPEIKNKIESNKIELIIPVGKMAIEYVLNTEDISLSEVIGKKYIQPIFSSVGKEKIIVPLPHPSGLSTWIFKEKNSELLKKALNHIKNHLK